MPNAIDLRGRLFCVTSVQKLAIILFILGCTASSFADAAIPLDFQGGHCDSTPDEIEFCKYARPKDWTEDEKNVLRGIVEKYAERGLRHFFLKAANGGKIQLQRFTSSANRDGKGVWSAVRTAEWISQEPDGTFAMNLSDAFFEVGDDPMSGVSRLELGLIHEIAHLHDLNSGPINSSPVFLEIIGWHFESKPPTFRGVPISDLRQEFATLSNLARSGQLSAAVLKNRQGGISHGMPTLYSITNPLECYAELVAYVVADPKVETYLQPEILAYIRETIDQKVVK